MKNTLIITLLFALLTSLLWNPDIVSADELSGHAHENGLRYLISKNALEKDASGSYNANNNVTRGEFASYLSKVLNFTENNEIQFNDVPDTYAFVLDIQRAATAGIITGYTDGSFKPDAAISRQHMAVMLERAIDYLKIPKGTSSITFKDNSSIIAEYRPAVAVGAHLGIINGSNGNFMPEKNATIGQAATFIQRLMKLSGDQDADFATYVIKEISNSALVGNQSYTTFEDAEKAMTKSNQVIVQNDKIVKMSSGYVVTNKYVALYSETIKDQISVAGNTEMEYLSSDATQVKVRFADQVGYLKQADVTLIPFSLSKGRSYYSNENGEIQHRLYDYATNKYSASYIYGKAPAFMKPNEEYYSWNGIYFTNANGSSKGTAYNYYQFLPARATTQYTAQEIDDYIMSKLSEMESTGLTIYKDATTKSKLIGLGTALKEVEANYQINAMLILSLAQHESAYGMSDHAQKLNNLFGLYVYDTNPLNKNFESVAVNINELVEKFLQPNYITPGGTPGKNYANGAVVGSKALGFNVKYASDPYWGAKIAGHYYRAEKAMGFKDAGNPYTIGLTTSTGLNVRTEPSTGNSPLYTYARSGMPVIVTSSDTDGWYEVISDKLYTGPAYISKEYIQFIDTVK
ncbi:endo-beta-N-acetylglucosaminidase [Lysinibacillus contaminans]|uniref:Endo-beta-N-acetylglucosaminidase n=1 Tax=Lysinibacillus contaminans TaxID=1293441 RepID=A0ABR5JYA4_9BACI|nr:S-layer homology domain-containing protein [Lysinibacillus contaminans]KOS66639.1 endo-beta-N-acetylglucosaminidase [Lysinibacillus contaminans]